MLGSVGSLNRLGANGRNVYGPSGASLWLDFTASDTLDSRITFTRASDATRFNSAGVLETVGSGVARARDFNPSTLAPSGFLIEEQRTNSIRNNTMQGAVAGTPGTLPTNWSFVGVSGITLSIIGTGAEAGISYVDIKISGTPTASSFCNIVFDTSIAASSGQSWTSSVYLKLAGGSLVNTSIVNEIREVNSVGGFLTNSTATVVPTSASLSTQQAILNRTLNNASTTNVRPIVSFQTTNGAAIDITLRVGLPQLELGAFATSVIPTSGTALTRNADTPPMTGTNYSSWANGTEGTIVAEYSAVASGVRTIIDFNDNTANESIRLRTDGTNPLFTVTDGGVDQANLDAGTIASNTVYKFAGAYKANDFAACINGGTVQTDTSGTLPTVTQAMLGYSAAGNRLNGHLRRIAFYPVKLSDPTLQALTT